MNNCFLPLTPLLALWILLVSTSCQNSNLPSSSPTNERNSKNLSLSELEFLITAKKNAGSRTDDLLASGNTFDMKQGLLTQYEYLVPSYIRLLKITRGLGFFSDIDPRDFVQQKVEPAYREAQIAYEKRLKEGTDGTGGSLDAPLEQLVRLEELIAEEVEFNSNDKTFTAWKKVWDEVE